MRQSPNPVAVAVPEVILETVALAEMEQQTTPPLDQVAVAAAAAALVLLIQVVLVEE
jgi:hypothetical protein